ncbi:MAG: hypothetical protein ACE37K_03025 [Planctomycetota bacterium]
MAPAAPTPCPWCGSMRGVVHVHGHAQCVTCGTNVDPCCSGDTGNDAATRTTTDEQVHVAPELFPLVFDGLGGRAITVTTDALLFALCNRLGSDLAEARMVLEAAERVGVVETARPGQHRLRELPPPNVDRRG